MAQTHSNPLQSSRVLILGATSGVGAAVASAALSRGASLYLSSSSPERVAGAAIKLKQLYPSAKVSGSAADLSDATTIEANLESVLKAAVRELGGPLDHIVYTAGEQLDMTALANVTGPGAFSGWTVRYVGPLLLGKLVAANPGVYLNPAASSSITLSGGTLGSRPRKGIAAKVAIAGATETLARSFAVDLAPIRANTVVMGPILTELLQRWDPEVRNAFGATTINKVLGKPEEAAEAYLFSMSAGYTTGQSLVVDGGSMVNGGA